MSNIFSHDLSFANELNKEFSAFISRQDKKFPKDEVLIMDMHCHDYNSDVPDELMGRILNVPETWLETDKLLDTLKNHGCNAFTITNHNNARSSFELADRGIDVLTAAEFSCFVPDFHVGIHVLTYGFTKEQEKILNKLRSNLYSFQDYTFENNIPTIWAHPLYHYSTKGMPPMDFFNKLSLLFERFEVINGQRDTWQNMLVKTWVESLIPSKINELADKYKIDPAKYCQHLYLKSMSGGSDSHMGIFAGLTGTQLHIKDLSNRLKTEKVSDLALEAIRKGRMAPFGSINNSDKMTITFLDYFMQIAIHSKDPGLLRILLHKGTSRDKIIALMVSNGFAELKRHKITMRFIDLFHDCFQGIPPHFTKRWFIPRVYKPIFDNAMKIADVRNEDPQKTLEVFSNSIYSIYDQLSTILSNRLVKKVSYLNNAGILNNFSLNDIIDSFEMPSNIRAIIENSKGKKIGKFGKGMAKINITEFLNGLSFPFLTSSLVVAANFTSARVMYNTRPLLATFAKEIGGIQHPKRILWLTDTFEDRNGVASVLKSLHIEIKKRNLPIDILTCSSNLQADDHLIVVKPKVEMNLPFYQQQPLRIPNILEIHKLFLEGEYDRIICSTEGPMGFISMFLKNAYHVPAYFYIHTDWIMFARKALNFDVHNLNRFRRLLRAFYGAFDGLFVLNTDQQKWLTGNHMNFDPANVFLTAHWADEQFTPKKKDKIDVFGVKPDETVILFAGRLSSEKGVMELPSIYESIKQSGSNVCFAIAGTGPTEAELKNALPDARYLGWIDSDRLAEVYSAADLLILPSKFDTFGCVVLEAFSCGLPVIAYKTKGPKDIINDGDNGYLVTNKDKMTKKIIEFINDKELQASMKISALERSKVFNADTILKELLENVKLPILS